MNNLKRLALASLLATVSASPLAATTADVKVIGTLTPVACTPALAGGGVIDYGNIATDKLTKDAYTLLSIKNVALQISCEGPVALAIQSSSLRPGSVAGGSESANGTAIPPVGMFGSTAANYHVAGLGLAGDKKIGGFAMRLQSGSAILDGETTESISSDIGKTWTKNSLGGLFSQGGRYIQSWMKKGDATLAPLQFKEMVGNLQVQAYINKSDELPLNQAIKLDGAASIELVYL